MGSSRRGGNGNPLQYSCLENPMDRGAWQASVHGVARAGHNLRTNHHSQNCSCRHDLIWIPWEYTDETGFLPSLTHSPTSVHPPSSFIPIVEGQLNSFLLSRVMDDKPCSKSWNQSYFNYLIFKLILAILGPLYFYVNFRISLSISILKKKPTGILIGIPLNL